MLYAMRTIFGQTVMNSADPDAKARLEAFIAGAAVAAGER